MKTDELSEINTTYCHKHPKNETRLSCVQCTNYICIHCAVHTGGGYKCPSCIDALKSRTLNGKIEDYFITPIVVFPLSVLMNFIFFIIGSYIFSIFIVLIGVPYITRFITRAVRFCIGYRRSRYIPHVAVTTFAFAVTPFVLINLAVGDFFSLVTTGCVLFFGTKALLQQLAS